MNNTEKIAYLRECDETISPTQLSMILGGMPYSYNLAAREGRLDLPHVFRGRNLRIFTAPLIKILQGGTYQ